MVKFFLGLGLLILSFFVLFFILRLWPLDGTPVQAQEQWRGFWTCKPCDIMPYEPRMFLIVVLFGAIGSILHVATSFSSYVGNQRFVESWVWWYVLRIPVGMGLAAIFYVVLRGGFFSPASGSVDPKEIVNPFGFAAVSALAGMFSKQATDKLMELFNNLFKTDEDANRRDKLSSLDYNVDSFDPVQFYVNIKDPKIKISGSGFTKEFKITFAGQDRVYRLNGSTQMIVELLEDDVKDVRVEELRVFCPAKKDGRIAVQAISIVDPVSSD